MKLLALAGLAAALGLLGCASADLVELSKSHQAYLDELERVLPEALRAQESALRAAAVVVQRQEEETSRMARLTSVRAALDEAARDSGLDEGPLRSEAIRQALERMLAYNRTRLREKEAEQAEREAKIQALTETFAALRAALAPVAAEQRAITRYLIRNRGMPVLGGQSLAEADNPRETVEQLKLIGHTLAEQFSRAREIAAAARVSLNQENPDGQR